MVTTLVSRKTIRDGLVTLFTADGSWQKVFGYLPTETEMDGQEPFLVIMSVGTETTMEGETMNPSEYTFSFTSVILADDTDVGGSLGSQNTIDKLDELDQKLRQVIRNNAAGGGFANSLNFVGGPSQVDSIVLYDTLHWAEVRAIKARHESGS